MKRNRLTIATNLHSCGVAASQEFFTTLGTLRTLATLTTLRLLGAFAGNVRRHFLHIISGKSSPLRNKLLLLRSKFINESITF